MTFLGAIIKNSRGSYDPPLGGTPVEFQVGKKWSGSSTQKRNNGQTYKLQQQTKIVRRETITVLSREFGQIMRSERSELVAINADRS